MIVVYLIDPIKSVWVYALVLVGLSVAGWESTVVVGVAGWESTVVVGAGIYGAVHHMCEIYPYSFLLYDKFNNKKIRRQYY
jgi:hypothetical protein